MAPLWWWWAVSLVVLTAECVPGAGTDGQHMKGAEPGATWESHLEYGRVDTDLTWRPSTHERNSTPCLGNCTCTVDFADCSGLGPTVLPVPSPGHDNTIKTLDLSSNNLTQLPVDLFATLFPQLQDLIAKKNEIPKFPNLRGLRLQNLQLGSNRIASIEINELAGQNQLTSLGLEWNQLTSLPGGLFKHNTHLAILNLGFNRISVIHEDAFQGLSALQILVVEGNQLIGIPAALFQHSPNIIILEINDNRLTDVPTALSSLQNLERVTLARNRIESLPSNIFQNCKKLQQIELGGNPIHTFHHEAFLNLPALRKLQVVSSPRLSHVFPNLTGTNRLELIHLDRASIASLPPNLCTLVPHLKTLRVRGNKITELPDLTACTQLRQLDLGLNHIEALDESPFKTLHHLQDLLLDRNRLQNLGPNVFVGLTKLHILDLELNNITEIHPETFLPLNNIKDLNVGQNRFAQLPYQGLKTVVELKAHNNPQLKDFPSAQMFPNIRLVRPSYAYHCCQFLPSTYEQSVQEYADFSDLTEKVYFPGDIEIGQFKNHSLHPVIWSEKGNLSLKLDQDLSIDLWENFVAGMGYPDVPDYDQNAGSFFKPPEGIDCYPAPGPFQPCNDLFDWWSLRCGVWIVFLLALLGNGCVVFVLVLSRSKMDVPRFLVANLAAADFFMGLYLGFLAVLDASTLGEFRKYAIQWQLSPACEIAGFFGVLSSELSVFTLAVITMERNYAITHAMHLNKRLSLKHASYIMIGAWSFSIFLASLPLFGISDYRKFAVCLPFETEGALSLTYVVFLMLINGVAFSILMGCYLKMYCAIRGSQAWNTNDSKIAKRMALLVFTDFICWFPIAFLAITAAFGLQLISLEGAKVFTVFVLPLNSCFNPFLYAILTKQFKKDCVMICKAIEESRVTRGIGRCRHSSNFSNRQTPANTNSLNSGSGSGNHSKNNNSGVHCSCNVKKAGKSAPNKWWPFAKLKNLLCGLKEPEDLAAQNKWNNQIAEIQQKQQKTKRNASVSSDNFSSSRSDSWKQGHCVPLRFIDRPRRRNSWTVTRKPSQDSNLSSSRNDSGASNSTQSTNTWRLSRASVSSDMSNSLARAGSGYSERSGVGGQENPSKFTALARVQALQRGKSSIQASSLPGPEVLVLRGKPKLIRQVAISEEGSILKGSGKSVSFHEPLRPAGSDTACPVHQDYAHTHAHASKYRTLYAKLTETSQEDEEEAAKDENHVCVTTHTQPRDTSSPSPPPPPPHHSPSPPPPRLPSFSSSSDIINSSAATALTAGTSSTVMMPSLEMPTPSTMVVAAVPGGAVRRPVSLLDLAAAGGGGALGGLHHSQAEEAKQRRISLGSWVGYQQRRGGGEALPEGNTREREQYSSLSSLSEAKYGPHRCTSENALLALQAKYGYSFRSAAEGAGIQRTSVHERGILGAGLHSGAELNKGVSTDSPTMRTAVVVEYRRSKSDEDDSADFRGQGEEGRALLAPRAPRHSLLLPLNRGSQGASDVETDRRTPTIEEEEPELEKLL